MSKKYQEHEKLSARIEEHEAICQFVGWLEEMGGALILQAENDPVHLRGQEEIIVSYFGINVKSYEAEKREMLKGMKERLKEIEGQTGLWGCAPLYRGGKIRVINTNII